MSKNNVNWLAEEIIAWQILLWYYGMGCRKMPDAIKKAGRRMDRNVNVITDLDGTKIVLINDIVFRGKRSVKARANICTTLWK